MPQDANHHSSNDSSALTLYSAESAQSAGPTLTGQHSVSSGRAGSNASGPDNREVDSAGHSIVKRVDSVALEASATQVVDEVFEDIDYLLDGVPPLHAASRSEGAGGPSFTTNVFIPPQSRAAEDGSSTTLNSMVMLWGLFPAIMAGLCLGLALAFGIVVGGRQAETSSSGSGSTPSAPSAEEDAFLTYLDQSLEAIERQDSDGSNAAAAESTPAGTARTSSVLSTNPFAGATPQLVPPPATVPTAGPALPLLPALPVQTTPIRLAPQSPAAPPQPPAETAAQPSPPPSQPEPQASASQADSVETAAAPEADPIPNISPSPHVLVGLLQLGDRSAAIFEFDDGARRVRMGETIGSSGWSLVSVSEDEAVIRRNGEVRSIYIGQRI